MCPAVFLWVKIVEGFSKRSIPESGSGRGNESCGFVSVKGLVASSTTSESGFERPSSITDSLFLIRAFSILVCVGLRRL